MSTRCLSPPDISWIERWAKSMAWVAKRPIGSVQVFPAFKLQPVQMGVPSHEDHLEGSEREPEMIFLGHHGHFLGKVRSIQDAKGLVSNQNLPLFGRQQTIHDLKECALARSIGPQYTQDLSGVKIKVDLLEGP